MQCIVYYQKCGVIIRFVTVCLSGNVVQPVLLKMWTFDQVQYCAYDQIDYCVYQDNQCSVDYQKCGTNHYNCLIALITSCCVVLTSKYCNGVFVLLSELFLSVKKGKKCDIVDTRTHTSCTTWQSVPNKCLFLLCRSGALQNK